MKFEIRFTHKFKKSLKKLQRSGSFDVEKFDYVIDTLSTGTSLSSRHRDHLLQGDFSGCRECHIESDLLLIYQIDPENNILYLIDIGSHPYLFGM